MFQTLTNKGSTPTMATRGIRYPVQLDNRVRTVRLWLTIAMTFTVTVAAAGAVKGTGLPSDVMQMAVSENGEDTYGVADLALLRALSQYRAASPLGGSGLRDQGVSVTALPVGVYNLTETFPVDFADPRTVDPMETAFMETDPKSRFLAEFVLNANAEASMVTPAGASVQAISAVTVTVKQEYASGLIGSLPLWKPRVRQLGGPIAGTAPNDPFYINSRDRLRSITLVAYATDANGGTQVATDAITAVRLIGDGPNANIIGPNQSNFNQLIEAQRALAGGDAAAREIFTAYFAPFGRQSGTILPANFPMLRFEASDNVSALGSTRWAAIVEELTSPPPSGDYRVVASELPAWATE